jgi:hypothetical protein
MDVASLIIQYLHLGDHKWPTRNNHINKKIPWMCMVNFAIPMKAKFLMSTMNFEGMCKIGMLGLGHWTQM